MKKRVLFLSVAVIAVVAFAFAGCAWFGNDGDTDDGGDDTSEDNSITFSGSISDVTTRSFTNKGGINTKSATGDLEIVVIYDPQKSWLLKEIQSGCRFEAGIKFPSPYIA